MIQKKFGNGMRDVLNRCHSLLRHSRGAVYARRCIALKKRLFNLSFPFTVSHALNSWLKVAKTLKTEKVTKNRRTFLHAVEF